MFDVFAVLNVSNTRHDDPIPLVKRVLLHPPSASRVLLPDGRYLAYLERGVPVKHARYSVISPHAFLSSRLGGHIPETPSFRDFYAHGSVI